MRTRTRESSETERNMTLKPITVHHVRLCKPECSKRNVCVVRLDIVTKKDISVVHNYEIEPENTRKTQRKQYFVQRRGKDEHNMVLALNKKHREEIINHSKEVYPLEACGMLVGFRELERRIVSEVRTARNVLNSSSSYEVDPEVELQAFVDAEKKSLEVVGMYHSHPHWTATPSSVDADLAFFEDVSYVIYSVSENSMASYVWNGRSFEPEEIEIR